MSKATRKLVKAFASGTSSTEAGELAKVILAAAELHRQRTDRQLARIRQQNEQNRARIELMAWQAGITGRERDFPQASVLADEAEAFLMQVAAHG